MRAIHGLWQGALIGGVLTALLVVLTVDDADPILVAVIGALLGALIGTAVGLLAFLRIFKNANTYALVGGIIGIVCFILVAIVGNVGAGEIVSNSETGILSGGVIGGFIGRLVGRGRQAVA